MRAILMTQCGDEGRALVEQSDAEDREAAERERMAAQAPEREDAAPAPARTPEPVAPAPASNVVQYLSARRQADGSHPPHYTRDGQPRIYPRMA